MRSESASSTDPALGSWMHNLFAKGTLSSRDIVRGASATVASHPNASGCLQRMAKVGEHNAWRSLKRYMTKDCQLPTAYRAKTFFWDHRRSCKKEGWLGFIPLHETLSAVVDSASADEWCVYDPLEEVLEADLVRTCSRLGTGRDRMAALRIWGDHAEYHTRDSLGLIMFSVMTGKVRRRFLICGFSKRSQCRCGCKGQCTFQTVWDVIGWSLRALIARRWPKRRHDNVLFSESALPGDRERAQRAGEVIPIGAVIKKKCGDWSWMKSAVGLQGWKDGVEGEVML